MVKKEETEETERVFNSYEKFHRHYFPNSVLERLVDKLSRELCANEPYQHKFQKGESDPLTGSIEVSKPRFGISKLEAIKKTIRQFYIDEGFKVKPCEGNCFQLISPSQEDYTAIITEHEDYYSVYVDKPL